MPFMGLLTHIWPRPARMDIRMNDRMFDLCIDLVAAAVASGFNVIWRGDRIILYLP